MATFKTLSFAALALVVIAAVVSSSPIDGNENELVRVAKTSNDLIVGVREWNDALIYHEDIAESYLLSGKKLILNRTIEAPANYIITQIKCLDQINDGTGAEPTVTGGGPKLNFVNLRFKSQRWHGIYFKVEVFAKPRYTG